MLLFAAEVHAQVNYQQQYLNAKQLFGEGKYNLAMAAFEPLMVYDQANPFSQYASFFYALSAYKQGFLSVASTSFQNLINTYPSWPQLNDVRYWLAVIHFDNARYFQAMLQLKDIDDAGMTKDIASLEKKYIPAITDFGTMETLSEQYPKDRIIALHYADLLSQNPSDENNDRLNDLVARFGFERSRFQTAIPKTVKKDTYAIAALLPLLTNTVEPNTLIKKNQIVLNLLEGMRLATDTLRKSGINIDLRAYDTKRNYDTIQHILSLDEMKHTDMIVGPLFPEEIPAVQNFALQQKIGAFNPISDQDDYLNGNPYFYLFQPGNAVIGEASAKFLDTYLANGKKRCMVFYGTARSDTVRANNFLRTAKETGLDIIYLHEVTRDNSALILDTLTDATDFDDYNYPTQYTLPLDSVNCIFVASDDPLIYTKVISSVESRGDTITVMGFESWLDKTASDYMKYQKANVIMAAPNYVPLGGRDYMAFRKKYLVTHGQLPDEFATIGYRFILFAGHLLDRYGVYFENGLHDNLIAPGWMSAGYDFRESQDNHYFPFIRFLHGELVEVGKP